MIIVNNTTLSNQDIGTIIDRIVSNRNADNKIIIGKIDIYTCQYNDTNYKVYVEYLKKHIRYVINEVK